MSDTRKTDNSNLEAKLELRRKLLRSQKQFSSLSVVDCFSGGEIIWGTLRKEFPVTEYLALDLKAKRRRLKLDSLRYLENQAWTHNVIDLDAYGSPWRHWFEVLKRGQSCIVFLTVGEIGWHMKQKDALTYCGINFDIPHYFHRGLDEIIRTQCLAAFHDFGFTANAAFEAKNPGGNARYFGIELVKNAKSTASRLQKTA